MINNINKTHHSLDYQADGQFGYDSPHGLSGQYIYMIVNCLFIFVTVICLYYSFFYKTCLVHEIYFDFDFD